MDNDKELLLVKLPKVENIDQDFFGVGYYSDGGFIFVLLTEEIMSKSPSRRFPFKNEVDYHSDTELEIIGQIKNLRRVI